LNQPALNANFKITPISATNRQETTPRQAGVTASAAKRRMPDEITVLDLFKAVGKAAYHRVAQL